MPQKFQSGVPSARSEPGFAEFVTLIAFAMSLSALGVDIMLPALGRIASDVALADPNDRQLVVNFFLLGFAAGQIFAGPLSDRFGRKPVLCAGLSLFAGASILATLTAEAGTLFGARALQGVGAAAPRILAVAIVRDRFSGRAMARVMSFIIMVFIILPIVAPAIGQGVMALSGWRWIFGTLVAIAVLALAWVMLRLPETHPQERRLPLSPQRLGHALATIVTTRQTLGYAIAFGFFFGVILSYITTAQQIFEDLYGLGAGFPLVFGGIAIVLIPAAFMNSRLVSRVGMRRVSHLALIGFLGLCGLMALAGYPEKPPLLVFCLFMSGTSVCFGMIGPNFNALAMEPVGHIAGTASSFIGFYTTGAATLFSFLIGQSFDGSVRPLCIGFTLLGLAGLVTVLIVERGQLARPHTTEPAQRS